jgi:hypothetical protein
MPRSGHCHLGSGRAQSFGVGDVTAYQVEADNAVGNVPSWVHVLGRRSVVILFNGGFMVWIKLFVESADVHVGFDLTIQAKVGDEICKEFLHLCDVSIHNAEVIAIEGDSYRLKEAKERSDQRARQRRRKA